MACFDLTFSCRCIAVDLGQSRVKAILAERKGSRIEVLHAFTLDLQEEGLLTLEETNRHISRILLEMGNYPVTLAIPQHIAVSHLISLPSEGKARRSRMIEAETQKLTGLSDSAIVYDYFRLKPSQKNRNPVWVTVGREQELEEQIGRLHGSGLAVGEVTNAGNALASAYLATQPPERKVVLIDIGATTTTVVALHRLQPVYAGSFPFGGELFTEALATSRQIPFDDAETLKKTEPIFDRKEEYPEFIEAVERWREEFEKVLGEWLKDETAAGEEPVTVMLSGGSSLQPGFLEYLQERSRLEYSLWRDSTRGVDSQTYAVAYGAALAGLKITPVKSSLLPKPLRQERFRAVQLTVVNTVAALLMIALFVLLLTDAAAKRDNLARKMDWIEELNEAYQQTRDVEELLARRNQEYNKIVPVVQRQKNTRDLLRTLALMQKVRAEHDVWFVLLADGRSYIERGAAAADPQDESQSSTRARAPRERAESPRGEASGGWNRFVVELSIPGQTRESHEVLRGVVEIFSSGSIFQNVDTLPASERARLVDEAVTLPEQTFPLNLELFPSDLSPAPSEEDDGSLLPSIATSK